MRSKFFKSGETVDDKMKITVTRDKTLVVRLFCFIFLLLSAYFSLNAQTTVSRLFSDHMVIQREQPVKIWGWADGATPVTVTLAGNSAQTVSQNGKWEVELPAMIAGGPHQISIQAETTTTISDVLVGDVWIAGGQSNMEWILKNTTDAIQELANANYPQIRFYKVPTALAHEPNAQVPGGNWRVADPQRAEIFSAVAWYFAKNNHIEKGVPVGIVESNLSGTTAEAWMALDAVSGVASYAADVANVLDPQKDWGAILAQNLLNDGLRFEIIGDTTLAKVPGTHLLDYDDSDWECLDIPNFDAILGVGWLRKTVLLNGTETDLTLNVGRMVNRGQIFFNGHLVYNKVTTQAQIVSIPTALLRQGKNVLSCRVGNPWGGRAFFGETDNMYIDIDGNRLPLEGEWKFSNTVEPPLPMVENFNQIPSFLYNGMIAPLTDFNVRGAIWYQGESNANRSGEYRELFGALIQNWRNSWEDQDMPFLFVQLANYQARQQQPTDPDWARLREAQAQNLALPNTGMATTIDIGDANDIHPRNKKDVGERLWLTAKKVSFGDDVVSSGPLYQSHQIVNNSISISYDHVGGGLQTNDGAVPLGFTIAGADRVFYWADAQIQGNEIIISASEVTNPVAVRYAWALNPATNLYNAEGLPAVPFRTDSW